MKVENLSSPEMLKSLRGSETMEGLNELLLKKSEEESKSGSTLSSENHAKCP